MSEQKKRQRFRGIKYLITSLSLVAVMGFWNYFSAQAKLYKDGDVNEGDDPEGDHTLLLEFPPIPTVAALENISKDAPGNVQIADEKIEKDQILRQVEAPTPMPKSSPKIGIIQVESSREGGGTIDSSPSTNTGSSR